MSNLPSSLILLHNDIDLKILCKDVFSLSRCVAIPLLMLQEWRWCLSYHLLHLHVVLWCPNLLARGGNRTIFGCRWNDYDCKDLPNS